MLNSRRAVRALRALQEIAIPYDPVPAAVTPALAERRWTQALMRYREPSHALSLMEIALTVGPLILLWALSWRLSQVSYALSLAISIPAAAFLVRLFMIQHDCGHGSFFRSRLLNDWVGRIMGVFTLTPYDFWSRTHAAHHATTGNLDKRGMGDIDTQTVSEYQAMSRWRRCLYRLYRHPIVMFGVGPAYLFLVQHRVPVGLMRAGIAPWMSAMATNAGIAVVFALLIWATGIGPFLVVHLPIVLIAASIGVWLFYVQHQFDPTLWVHQRDWSFQEAALHGSSHYDLPWILRWLTANIGVHHVHHLCARIPFYRLPQVLRDFPELDGVGRVTLWQSFGFVRLALWDEAQRRLISFREFRQRYGRRPTTG